MNLLLTNPEALLWLILIVVSLITEAITAGLVTIWFAVGALAGMVIALLGLPLWLQILVFIAVSGLVLLATKPLVEKLVNNKTVKTNADRVLGAVGIVTESISNIDDVGQAKVCGQLWSARATDGVPIEKGTKVVINKIEGVKLFVEITEA